MKSTDEISFIGVRIMHDGNVVHCFQLQQHIFQYLCTAIVFPTWKSASVGLDVNEGRVYVEFGRSTDPSIVMRNPKGSFLRATSERRVVTSAPVLWILNSPPNIHMSHGFFFHPRRAERKRTSKSIRIVRTFYGLLNLVNSIRPHRGS